MSELQIAVPRGALFAETLDLLDRLGVDTREVRENDRKLLFDDVGIVTMRPSDVPTYVEAGAADLGITGKDVLMEQSEREVYELVDLGYGHCRMVLATVAGEDRAAEALRRLGVVRIATKYPRIAARHFLETGRQAEIVEVKGSVELAPLTGLAEGIVDLTATGTTLRENGLVVREEIAVSTARLIANPVAHKLKADAIDPAAGAAECGVSRARGRRPGSARGRAPGPRSGRRVGPRCRRRDHRRSALAGDEALLEYTRGSTPPAPSRRASGRGGRARGGGERSGPRRARRTRAGDPQRPPRRRGGAAPRRHGPVRPPRGHARSSPVASAGVYVPGGRAPYPSTVVMGVVTARVAGVERVSVCAPPGRDGDLHPVVLGACWLAGADAVYRVGGAQAIGGAGVSAPNRSTAST